MKEFETVLFNAGDGFQNHRRLEEELACQSGSIDLDPCMFQRTIASIEQVITNP
jgi:hypothetical protein